MIFVTGIAIVPPMWLLLASVVRNMDPALEEAGATSRAGGVDLLRRITIPLMDSGYRRRGCLLRDRHHGVLRDSTDHRASRPGRGAEHTHLSRRHGNDGRHLCLRGSSRSGHGGRRLRLPGDTPIPPACTKSLTLHSRHWEGPTDRESSTWGGGVTPPWRLSSRTC